MRDNPARPVFEDLPEGVAPVGYPVRLGNPDEILAAMEKRRVFLKIHWRTMPAEALAECPVTRRVSRTIITLPIYPHLRRQDMERIAAFLAGNARPVGRAED